MHPGVREWPGTPIRSAHVSFRNRLALFFVLIVIVPMLAVAFLLFRLIDESERGQTRRGDRPAAQHRAAALRRAARASRRRRWPRWPGRRARRDRGLPQRAAGREQRPRACAAGGGAHHRQPARLPVLSRRIRRIVFVRGRRGRAAGRRPRGDRARRAPLQSDGRPRARRARAVGHRRRHVRRRVRTLTKGGERPGCTSSCSTARGCSPARCRRSTSRPLRATQGTRR